jgi:hypothetical protein
MSSTRPLPTAKDPIVSLVALMLMTGGAIPHRILPQLWASIRHLQIGYSTRVEHGQVRLESIRMSGNMDGQIQARIGDLLLEQWMALDKDVTRGSYGPSGPPAEGVTLSETEKGAQETRACVWTNTKPLIAVIYVLQVLEGLPATAEEADVMEADYKLGQVEYLAKARWPAKMDVVNTIAQALAAHPLRVPRPPRPVPAHSLAGQVGAKSSAARRAPARYAGPGWPPAMKALLAQLLAHPEQVGGSTAQVVQAMEVQHDDIEMARVAWGQSPRGLGRVVRRG